MTTREQCDRPQPCPFCGGDAVVDQAGGAMIERFVMRCNSCAAEGPWGKSEASARGGWSRRVVDDRVDAAEKERDEARAEASATADAAEAQRQRAKNAENACKDMQARIARAERSIEEHAALCREVDSLRVRAEKAEAEVARLREALGKIRPPKDGNTAIHPWSVDGAALIDEALAAPASPPAKVEPAEDASPTGDDLAALLVTGTNICRACEHSDMDHDVDGCEICHCRVDGRQLSRAVNAAAKAAP